MNPIKAAVGRTANCPGLETLAQKPRKPDVERHLETCSHCRAELALMHEFENAEPQPDEMAAVQWIESELRRREAAVTVPLPSTWNRFFGWLQMAFAPGRHRAFAAVAASLVIAVAAGVYFRSGDTARLPGNTAGDLWRSTALATISPAGEITQTPTELHWEAVPGARRYQVQIMQVDRTVVWTGESDQTTVQIPRNIREQLKPGRAFQWKVIAHNAAGEQIASSDLQIFHIIVTNR
jgi:hypothetical protein